MDSTAPKRRREKGEGTILHLPNGKWKKARKGVLCGDGRVRTITGTGDSVGEAKRRYEANFARRMAPDAGTKRQLKTVVADWKATTTNTAESQVQLLTSIRLHVYPHIPASTPLGKIDSRKVDAMIDALRASGATDGTMNRAYKHLRTILSHAVRKRWLTSHPMAGMTPPTYVPAVIEDDAYFVNRRLGLYKGLIRHLRETDHEAYTWVLFLSLGLRKSELIGLTWDCVSNLGDASKTRLTIRQTFLPNPPRIEKRTKNKKNRRFPLPRAYVLALREWKTTWEEPEQEWAKDQIFVRKGKRGRVTGYSAQRIDEDWKAILRAYIEKDGPKDDYVEKWYFRMHFTRHLATSIMTNAGVPPAVSREIIGHGGDEMHRHYTHLTGVEGQHAVDTLARELGIPEPPPRRV